MDVRIKDERQSKINFIYWKLLKMEMKYNYLIEESLLQHLLFLFILCCVSHPASNMCVKMTKNEVLKLIKYV